MGANNNAKLREAVGALLAWAEGNLRLTPDLLKEGTRECSEFVAMCCKSALDEPQRNCERYDSGVEAYRDWRKNYATCDDNKAENEEFNEWLFATTKGSEAGK